MRRFFSLYLVVLPFWISSAFAEVEADAPQTRRSQIRLSVSSSRNEFRATELSANIGLDEKWSFVSGIGGERSEGTRTATSWYAGFDTQISPSIDANISFQSRRDLGEVRAAGVSSGVGWEVSSLWHGEYATELATQFTYLKYTADAQGPTRLREEGIRHHSVNLLLSQELSEAVSLSLSGTRYGFGNSTADELSAAISSRPNLSSPVLSVVNGFPKRAYGLNVDWQCSESLLFSPSVFRVEYESGASSKGLGLSSTLELSRNWNITLGFSGTRNSDASTSGLVDFALGYRW